MRLRAVFAAVVLALSLFCGAAFAQTPGELADLETRARAGDMEAAEELGVYLMTSQKTERLPEARRWTELAAQAGRPEAINNLATMLQMGIGGRQNEARGRELREEAARAGSIGANLTLAFAHQVGANGYPRNLERAYRYVVAAANSPLGGHGAADAQWRAGMMTLQGQGIPANEEAAYAWVARAAENGSVQGMISRAVMLATAEGVAENDAEAREWYRRAAESGASGSAHALRGLAGMLLSGEGGPVDAARGYAYLKLAGAAGDPIGRRMAPVVAGDLDAETVRRAEEIGREWLRDHPAPLPDEPAPPADAGPERMG
jgi:TPR repeat protein